MDDRALEFQKIYHAYQPKILRYLVRMVGEYEAEDLTQEVFVRVDQALQAFRGQAQLSTWLYRIATNAAIDKIRTFSFRQGAGQSPLDEAAETGDQDAWSGEESPSPEQHMMRKEMIECFENHLGNLPVDYRTVVVLSELEELTNNEIADILGLSLEAVKMRLHRGRTRLFQELKAHCKAEDWL